VENVKFSIFWEQRVIWDSQTFNTVGYPSLGGSGKAGKESRNHATSWCS
jgi:hypothetical protein